MPLMLLATLPTDSERKKIEKRAQVLMCQSKMGGSLIYLKDIS